MLEIEMRPSVRSMSIVVALTLLRDLSQCLRSGGLDQSEVRCITAHVPG